MTHLISCEFNMDTVCVELKFADGSMIFIDTIVWENEVADNMSQCSELDWLNQLTISGCFITEQIIGFEKLIIQCQKNTGDHQRLVLILQGAIGA